MGRLSGSTVSSNTLKKWLIWLPMPHLIENKSLYGNTNYLIGLGSVRASNADQQDAVLILNRVLKSIHLWQSKS